jgi:hypothetical protein
LGHLTQTGLEVIIDIVFCKGVNWIRRGSRGCRGMPSAPRLETIVEIKSTADTQLALAA